MVVWFHKRASNHVAPPNIGSRATTSSIQGATGGLELHDARAPAKIRQKSRRATCMRAEHKGSVSLPRSVAGFGGRWLQVFGAVALLALFGGSVAALMIVKDRIDIVITDSAAADSIDPLALVEDDLRGGAHAPALRPRERATEGGEGGRWPPREQKRKSATTVIFLIGLHKMQTPIAVVKNFPMHI